MVDLASPQCPRRNIALPTPCVCVGNTVRPAGPTARSRDERRPTEPGRSAEFADVARELHAQHESTENTHTAITAAALRVVSGVDSASTTVLSGKGRTRFHAPTDNLAAAADEIQSDVDDGPSLVSVRSNEVVLTCDIRYEARFPVFTAEILGRTMIRSILSVPLHTGSALLGAVTVYSLTAGAFSASSVEAVTVLATHAALALVHSTQHEQFARALTSRDSIGQAKGMIMEQYKTDAQQAFDILSMISQDTNVSVSTLAARLTRGEHRRLEEPADAS
ncbi:GAF and ANTAR domain-containing protein [Rhodococcus sp. NPDC076796]|uniref:GAF and ANTAR domain-containing protein n=1 Tax=Rhodococcus sp. NPDC076796 TaxID=3154859 RepID=UPI00344EE5C4